MFASIACVTSDRATVAAGAVSVEGLGTIWIDCPRCGPGAPQVSSSHRSRWTGTVGHRAKVEETEYRVHLSWFDGPSGEALPHGPCGRCGREAPGHLMAAA